MQALRDAGANHVASTLAQTREYVGGLEEIPRMPVPARPATHVAEREVTPGVRDASVLL